VSQQHASAAVALDLQLVQGFAFVHMLAQLSEARPFAACDLVACEAPHWDYH